MTAEMRASRFPPKSSVLGGERGRLPFHQTYLRPLYKLYEATRGRTVLFRLRLESAVVLVVG